MLITEKLLGDLGGWQVMKAARALVAVPAVEQAAREGDVFRGLVREGKRKFAATLTVQGPTKAEARCSCADAQRGLVCAHAIAVALAALPSTAASAASNPPSATAGTQSPAAPVTHQPVPHGRFDVFIPASRIEAMREGRGQLPVFLQFQSGGNETDPVAQWLVAQGIPVQSGPLSLDAVAAGGLFHVLRGHPRIWDGKPGAGPAHRRPFRLSDAQDAITLRADLNSSGEAASFALVAATQGVGAANSGTEGVPLLELSPLRLGRSLWIFDATHGALHEISQGAPEPEKLISECLEKKSGGVMRDLRWLARNLEALEQVLPLETDEALSHLRVLPAEPQCVIELDGSPRQVTARVEIQVGTTRHSFSPGTATSGGDPYPIPANDGTLTFWTRNAKAESRLQSELETAGFSVSAEDQWVLRGEREVAEFFSTALPRLRQRHEIVFTERWQSAFRGWQRILPLVRRSDTASQAGFEPSRGWLDMEFAYEAADGFRVPRHELLRLLRSGQTSVRGRQGQVYVVDTASCDDFESLLAESGARLGEGGKVGLSAENSHVFNEFLAAGQPVAKLVLPDAAEVRCRIGESLSARLRPYQFEGVRWLIGSAVAGRGALLADDMGLGKTLQVIALLRWLANGEQVGNCEQLSRNGVLVVCPTSLIHNWAAEIQKFAPDLPVQIQHGSERVLNKVVHRPFTVFLTSYALLTRDLPFHQEGCYQAVVLDEASHIRNPETAVAKAVCGLDAPVRVALSGTPVENSVRDLWSLMRFVQPGLLGGQKDFQEHYAKPLAAAETDPVTAERTARRLRTRLGPFVLRRTKKEVVRELPDKIEKVILCELSDRQKEVYKRLLEEGQSEIREARRRGAGAGRMTMFTVLLRLRQACNDLRLLGLHLGKADPEASTVLSRRPEQESQSHDASTVEARGATAGEDERNYGAETESTDGKWPALTDIVDEALGGGHKMLIFSQFTGMLRLLRAWFDNRGVTYSYLDGSTRDRAKEVDAFQSGSERKVFLISLKAGGYGLNLTAADHVILMEPWWNPAVENQAIDRAHRIGQANAVTASRLIARGTVEERILKLQASKRQFMASAVEDDPLTLPGLTDDDLESLFA